MSLTSKTRVRRAIRKKKAGKERKKNLEKKGTTPAFPVHQS